MFNNNHIISYNLIISMSHVTKACVCATYNRLAIPLACYNCISYNMIKQFGNNSKKD